MSEKCPDCGAELQIGDWPFCRRTGSHEPTRARLSQTFDPVVIHRDAAGNVRFPASPDSPVPSGFAKVELRTVHEVRKFEREVNGKERARWDEHRERVARAAEESTRARRSELLDAMQHMSPYGRDFARQAMDANDRKSAGSYDAGFHIEAFSQDSSNRAPHRDERTGWRARRS